MLRFLADESCDFAAVRALRTEGFDVLSVAEASAGADDERVIELALHERRILLTEDKDFGFLAQAVSATRIGVVLLRFPTRARTQLAETVVDTVARLGAQLNGAFVVIEPDQVRISRL